MATTERLLGTLRDIASLKHDTQVRSDEAKELCDLGLIEDYGSGRYVLTPEARR